MAWLAASISFRRTGLTYKTQGTAVPRSKAEHPAPHLPLGVWWSLRNAALRFQAGVPRGLAADARLCEGAWDSLGSCFPLVRRPPPLTLVSKGPQGQSWTLQKGEHRPGPKRRLAGYRAQSSFRLNRDISPQHHGAYLTGGLPVC